MKGKKVLAWHSTRGMELRDGTPLVVGKMYRHKGDLVMCDKGYHASVSIIDALRYAPGWQLSRVECSGEMIEGDDKLVCRARKALWTVDAKKPIVAWSFRVATDAVKMKRKTSKNAKWNAWADKWISGEDRTRASAAYATDAAAYASDAAAYAASDAAAYASDAAADAAYAAYAYADAADAYADAARKKARAKYERWLIAAIEKARK